jgi:hypothetical protein
MHANAATDVRMLLEVLQQALVAACMTASMPHPLSAAAPAVEF